MGARGTSEDTTDTVQDREAPGSNPGPPPILIAEALGSALHTTVGVAAVSQVCHRFWKNSVAVARLGVARNPRLNSRIVTRQPIYHHAHGTGTVRHRGSKIQPGELHQIQASSKIPRRLGAVLR